MIGVLVLAGRSFFGFWWVLGVMIRRKVGFLVGCGYIFGERFLVCVFLFGYFMFKIVFSFVVVLLF